MPDHGTPFPPAKLAPEVPDSLAAAVPELRASAPSAIWAIAPSPPPAASPRSALSGTGDRLYEAGIVTHLGDTRHAAGELARETRQQALAILDDLQHRHADQVRAKLASATAWLPYPVPAATRRWPRAPLAFLLSG